MKENIVEELGKSRNTRNANPKPNLSKNQTLGLDPSKKKTYKDDPKMKTTLTPLKIKMKKQEEYLGATPQWPKEWLASKPPIKLQT